MRQPRWLKLVKDYDCDLEKENVVADALSRKSSSSIASLREIQPRILDIQRLEMEIVNLEDTAIWLP